MNMYKNKWLKGKTIQLDADLSQSNKGAVEDGDGVQGSKAQSTMNS